MCTPQEEYFNISPKAINNYSFSVEAVDAIFMQSFRSQITLEWELDVSGSGQV